MITWLLFSLLAFVLLYLMSWIEDVLWMNRPFNRKSALIFSLLFFLGGPITVAAIILSLIVLYT
jgi:hypothetical protein